MGLDEITQECRREIQRLSLGMPEYRLRNKEKWVTNEEQGKSRESYVVKTLHGDRCQENESSQCWLVKPDEDWEFTSIHGNIVIIADVGKVHFSGVVEAVLMRRVE